MGYDAKFEEIQTSKSLTKEISNKIEDWDQICVNPLNWREHFIEIFVDLRGWVAKKRAFISMRGQWAIVGGDEC